MKIQTQKTMTGILIFCLVLSLTGIVSAQNESVVSEDKETIVNAGATPGSVLYGLDRAMENIRMALIFNKEKKAEYGLRLAEERLAEAKELSEKGEKERAQKAVQGHKEIMEKVQENIEKIESNGNNESSKKALDSTYSLEERLQKHRQKIARVHSNILERLRNESNMSKEQINHLENVFGKVQNHSKGVEEKILQKRDKAKMRYKVLSNKTDKEIESEFQNQSKELEEIKGDIEKNKENRQEKVRERVEEIIQKKKNSLENLSEKNSKASEKSLKHGMPQMNRGSKNNSISQ